MSTDNPLLTAALQYAKRGWHVFPCTWIVNGECSCSGRAENCTPGKHPLIADGLYGATTDPLLIEAWWKKWPLANVAIRTGAESGVVGIDIDDLAIAKPALQKLCPRYDFKSVPVQKTGKGWHLVFRHPGGQIKTVTKFLPG